MTKYAFDCLVVATYTVEAENEEEAHAALHEHFNGATVDAGIWCLDGSRLRGEDAELVGCPAPSIHMASLQ